MLFDSADIVESVFLGVALAMDAMAVTLANLLAEPHMPKAKKIAMPLAFAVFQMAMPVFGYFGGMLMLRISMPMPVSFRLLSSASWAAR